MSETTQIDLLFLELSQFTKAKTKRELELEARAEAAEATLDRVRGITVEELWLQFSSEIERIKTLPTDQERRQIRDADDVSVFMSVKGVEVIHRLLTERMEGK